MSPLQAVFYRAADGREPVRQYVNSLDAKRRNALREQIKRINQLDDATPHLPYPQSSQIRGELRELRCHFGSELYRVLYRRSGRLIVLLHIFRKLTARVPSAEQRIAEERWTDFKGRMDARPRSGPRAAGHDAP
jgi:phage-related protein